MAPKFSKCDIAAYQKAPPRARYILFHIYTIFITHYYAGSKRTSQYQNQKSDDGRGRELSSYERVPDQPFGLDLRLTAQVQPADRGNVQRLFCRRQPSPRACEELHRFHHLRLYRSSGLMPVLEHPCPLSIIHLNRPHVKHYQHSRALLTAF